MCKLTDNLEVNGGFALSQLVDGFDTVLPSVLRHTVANIQGDVAKVECNVEARR